MLPHTVEIYLRLFDAVGIPTAWAREAAVDLEDVVASWSVPLFEEMDGIAAGASLERWQVMMLNARTEILSQSPGLVAGECSTIAFDARRADQVPFGVQTWDWHEEVDPFWHTQQVIGSRHSYVGMTECGIISKIGVNSAGVGVLFNILGHRDDGPRGIPMHVLAAAVLADADSVEHAFELLSAAPVSTSGALTLVDTHSVVCVELSPSGITRVPPVRGFSLHTNHFLGSTHASGEKPGLYEPDSQQRLELMSSRLDGAGRYPTTPGDLVEHLRSSPGEPRLCCSPEPGAAFGDRWATLATVQLEPLHRRARILSGSPNEARIRPWTELRACSSPSLANPTGRAIEESENW